MYLYLDYYLFNIKNNDIYKIYSYIIDQMDEKTSMDQIDAYFRDNPEALGYLDIGDQMLDPDEHQLIPYRTDYEYRQSEDDTYYTIRAGSKCLIEYTFNDAFTILNITLFYCEGETKYTGAKMLHDLLILLKNQYQTLTSIVLTADAAVDYDAGRTKSTSDLAVDQARLNQYYIDIGFVKRHEDQNIFDGQVDTIISDIETFIIRKNEISGGKKK